MITSRVGRGLIYAGETPLACTITVEQTAPMQLTVREGYFHSTGDRKRGVIPQKYTLVGDRVVNLVSDPVEPVAYDLDLVSDGTTTTVLVKNRVGAWEYKPLDPPWVKIHELLYEFVLPPECSNVDTIPMYLLVVRPGFPEGTGPKDWKQQTGSV